MNPSFDVSGAPTNAFLVRTQESAKWEAEQAKWEAKLANLTEEKEQEIAALEANLTGEKEQEIAAIEAKLYRVVEQRNARHCGCIIA